MSSEKLFLTLGELSQKTGLPRQSLRTLANKKQIPALRIGRRLFFNFTSVEQIFNKLAQADAGKKLKPTILSGGHNV